MGLVTNFKSMPTKSSSCFESDLVTNYFTALVARFKSLPTKSSSRFKGDLVARFY